MLNFEQSLEGNKLPNLIKPIYENKNQKDVAKDFFEILKEKFERDGLKMEREEKNCYWYILGNCYKNGIGIEKNKEKAVELFENSIELKYSQNEMLLFANELIDTNKENSLRALDIFEKVSLQDNDKAFEKLGEIYYFGSDYLGIKSNFEKAIDFFKKSIKLKNSKYLLLLALHYSNHEKNIPKAIELLENNLNIACEFTIYHLAEFYNQSKDLKNHSYNVKKAIQYYHLASERNHFFSSKILACKYRDGDEKFGIKKDPEKSAYYYFKNFRFGDDSDTFDSYSISKQDSKLQFFYLIHHNKVEWRKEYHVYWKSEENLNQKIIILLLISKFKREIHNRTISQILVKGIVMKIIKYLCHFTQKNY